MRIAVEQLSEDARERVRKQSKTLFGNRDTLEVAVAVACDETGVVNATDIGYALRLAPNRVRAQLTAFAELGYLMDSPIREGRRWFIRLDARFWSMCLDLYEDWAG